MEYNEKVKVDFKNYDGLEVFEDIYLVEGSVTITANSTLCVRGVDYPIHAVSFIGNNTCAIKIGIKGKQVNGGNE